MIAPETEFPAAGGLRTSPIAAWLGLPDETGRRDGCVTAAAYAASARTEYEALRQRVALIDQHHATRIRVEGTDAFELINSVILTDLARLAVDQAQPTFFIDAAGAPLADGFVLNLGDSYLLLCEGRPHAELLAHLQSRAATRFPQARLADETLSLGQIGLEGPYAWELLKNLLGIGIIGMRYMEVLAEQQLGEIPFTLLRAGKSGEYGYVLLTPTEHAAALWSLLHEAGRDFELQPVGYRVADGCRLENRFPNMYKEALHVDNVLELNTCVMVGRDKGDYEARDRIEQLLAGGPAHRIVGVSFADGGDPAQAPASEGAEVRCGGEAIGLLANLAWSETLRRWIGLARVDALYAVVGLDYRVGGSAAQTVSAPFIFNRSLQIRPQEDSFFE